MPGSASNVVKLAYDAYDSVISTKGPAGKVEFAYTPLGSLEKRTENGVSVHFEYDRMERLDAVRRRRWLEGADRLREGSPRARRTAEEIYRALEADLDPTRSEGRTRAIHLMHHASTYDEVLFGILARFDAVVEGRDRDRGRMMAARCLGTIGRLDEAIEILEGLVGDTYLRGTPFEFEVIVSYAVLLVWQRRGSRARVRLGP